MRGSRFRGVALGTLVILAFTGCAEVSQNPKTTIGALGGAALGGLIAGAAGGNSAGIAAGVIGGGLLGGLVGNVLDERDRRLAAQATHRTLETTPSGKSVPWNNPDNGHAGTVTPAHTYQTPNGAYCREYETTITINDRQERSYGRACRQPDGSWQIAQ